MATQKFAASASTSDGLTVWPWTSGTGFGTRYAAPASLPTNYVTGAYAPRFNSKCTSLLVTTQGTPFIQGWKWTSSGYGTKYSNPAVLPTTPTGLSFLDDDEIAMSSSAGSFIYTYPFDSVTGYGTRYASTGAQSANSVTSKGGAAFFSHAGTPFISMYPRAYPGFGTKYANPSSLPSAPTTAAGARGSLLSVTDANIVMQQTAAPNYAAWPWTLAGGFGTRYTATNMTTGMTGLTCYVTDSMLPSYLGGILVIGGSATGSSNYIKIAQWSNGYFPPQGSTYASPSVAPAFYPNSIAYDRTTDPGTIFLSCQSTAYIQAWSIYAGSWGTRYANSSSNGGGYGVTFGILQESMTADASSFAFTGNAATLTKSTSAGYTLTASAGSFSLTGKAAGLAIGRKVTASQGTFSLTGIASGLKAARKVTADTRSFAITGIDATLTKTTVAGYTLTASAGSFSLTGNATNLAVGRKVTATQGSFSLTGITAGLKATRIVTATTQSFALTGIAANLKAARTITGAVRTFALTGIDNRLASTRKVTASTISFALAGYSANLVTTASKNIFASTGSFSLTGISSILSKGSKTSASVGVFTVGTSSAALVSTRIIVSGSGTLSLSGQPSTPAFNRKLPISSRQFVVSGIASNLFRTRSLYATPRQFLLTGNTAYLITIIPPLICQAGTFTLPVLAAAARYSNSKVSQFPPRLEFNSTGKNVNLKPSRAIIGTMSFAMEQTACALRWHRI